MNGKKIIQALKKDGWILKRTVGSHHHFFHPSKKGLVTVPHPKRNLPTGTLRSIEKQADIKFGGDS